jgi:hypothetical protein
MQTRALTANTVVSSHDANDLHSETLCVPPNLIDLKSPEGAQLFLQSEAWSAYFPLAINFVTQENQAYCGAASIVMVLNALQVRAPKSTQFAPYRMFTQDNLVNGRTEVIVPRAVILQRGMTLDQIGGILSLFSLEVEVHHTADTSLQQFRAMARDSLGKSDHAVIVNYLRRAIGQERGGHISPLAAYDTKSDRFLILDVARYKYPPVWVKASELYDSMNTADADNEERTRGFVLVSSVKYSEALRAITIGLGDARPEQEAAPSGPWQSRRPPDGYRRDVARRPDRTGLDFRNI